MKRAARAGALLLTCAACAHGPASRGGPAPTGGPTDYDVPSAAAEAPPAPASGGGGHAEDKSPGPSAASQLAAVRASVDELLASQGKLLWEAWTRGAPPDLGALMARRDPVASPATLALVREERARATGVDRRALSLLHAFLVGEHLSAEAASAPNAAQAAVAWRGRPVAARQVPALLAAEPDAARRAALEHAWAEAERRRGAGDDARWQAMAAAARRLGHDSLLGLAADVRGQPIDDLVALAQGALAATGPAYRALLDARARAEMGKDLSDLRGRDLPRLLRAGEDARAFPAGRASGYALETLAGMGLGLANRPGVVLDLEARPGKDPRALALPVEVPGDVRVSFAPQGGAPEMRAILHEMGAAAFYAHVKAQPVEFRRLGTVTAECWAFLFEDLADDPAWLAERTGLPEGHVAAIVGGGAARRLHAARTLAARLLVEVARGRDPARARDTAKAVLETAFGHPVEADELDLFLRERDPLLESADGLRAILLAAQAAAHLEARAGPAWWRSKESGAWLAAAFAEGSRLAPDELARTFGAAGVDAAALSRSTRARAAAAGVRLAQAERP